MTLAAIGSAIWKFLKGLPAWVWYVVLAIAAGYFIDLRARGQQRTKDKAAFDKEAAEAEAQVITNITENTNAAIREADAVRERTSAHVLPDGTTTLEGYNYRD